MAMEPSFSRKTWDIVGQDVIVAVMEFFKKGEVGQMNGTLVTLIPKRFNAKTIREYMPIFYCIATYNIISKVLPTRMSKIMSSIMSKNQPAFVLGQKTNDHILLMSLS